MNLATQYLGLSLQSPIVVSASRLSENLDNIKAMALAGAGAIVMYSIFEEEITLNKDFYKYMVQLSTHHQKGAADYSLKNQKKFLDDYLSHLAKAAKLVAIPIIGSINAATNNSWFEYAIEMQSTGIKALELNLYYLPMDNQASANLENQYLEVIKLLKEKLSIPVIIKLNPYFTSIKDFVFKLDKESHVDGIVLFNRFFYPDIDIDTYQFKPNIFLSNSYEARLSMRWIAALYGEVACSIAGGIGVDTPEDLIKYLLVGSNVVTCASGLLRHGISHIKTLLHGLEKWMEKKQYTSIDQFRGLFSLKYTKNKTMFERVQYLRALRGFKY